MSDVSNTLRWGPGLLGYAVSGLMYGVTAGQSICYAYWFPKDPWLMRTFVSVMFLADTIHMIGSSQLFWETLVACRRNYSWSCIHEVPQGVYVVAWLNYMITFAVQCFYCHRVWTMSGKNKLLTLIIFSLAAGGFGCSIFFSIEVARVGTVDYMFSGPYILPFAIASTLCDFIITSAVFKYMWKSGFRKHRTVIQDLAVVCINTGAFTCAVSLITGLVYLAQSNNYLVVAVGIIISRSYVNSMLAVLNARRAIREREAQNVYDLTTTPAMLFSRPFSVTPNSRCT